MRKLVVRHGIKAGGGTVLFWLFSFHDYVLPSLDLFFPFSTVRVVLGLTKNVPNFFLVCLALCLTFTGISPVVFKASWIIAILWRADRDIKLHYRGMISLLKLICHVSCVFVLLISCIIVFIIIC